VTIAAGTASAVPVGVRTLSTDEHLAFLRSLPSASFLQTPAWGQVKSEWAHESLGLFVGNAQVGSALVLYRRLPRIGRSLAYLPEGPVLDWESPQLPRLLDSMVAHLRARGAFGVRMGPPVVTRAWEAATVKAGLADPALHRLGDVPPDEVSASGRRLVGLLEDRGWRLQGEGAGFAAGQPRYNFWLPLAGRTEADVLAGMNQLWRRNIKKAAKAGVEVRRGERSDLAAFHRVYVETARRDVFTPRPQSYFETMYDALNAEEPGRLRLYLACHEDDLIAATTLVQVGEHAWYSYGASTAAKREVRGSNAVQWQMIRDALASGASVYDLRGITDTLDESDSHVGLVQFKAGTGGRAVEYAGEWDLPLSRPLYKAFELYLKYR
jgi:vancomycin resistance protein VanK